MQELAPMAGQLAGELRRQIACQEPCPNPEVLDKDDADPHLTDPDYRLLWSCLGFDPRPADVIIEQSGLTAGAVSAMLMMLELRGKVEVHPGGAYSRK